MTRKTAFRHDVGSYTRNDGKRVETYKRGKGPKPKFVLAPRKRDKPTGEFRKKTKRSGKLYSIKFRLADGSSETYTGTGTLSGAIKQATAKIQRPSLPVRADWEMIT